jgi:hypothetical protein
MSVLQQFAETFDGRGQLVSQIVIVEVLNPHSANVDPDRKIMGLETWPIDVKILAVVVALYVEHGGNARQFQFVNIIHRVGARADEEIRQDLVNIHSSRGLPKG